MKKTSETLRGDHYFNRDQLLFVNRATENFYAPFHNHDFLEIAFIAEGDGFHHAGDEVMKVRKGELFYIPIGYSHVFRPNSLSGKPLIVYNCVFSALLLQKLIAFSSDPGFISYLKQMEAGGLAFRAFRDRNGRFQKLFASLYEHYASPLAGAADYRHALLLQLLIELHQEQELERKDGRDGLSDASFRHVLHYLELHYGEELSLAALAETSGFSERHLQRLFHRHTGQTWHRYLQAFRIQKSGELLRGTDDKISIVAEKVGYRDIQSFVAVFKRITGLTPSQFRGKQLP
ncbi:AraC family transcriptional regulator [Paenibacillus soyae]|uniref:AraC family transcriptional regulator n=1 Tax=Paenibacillus soyae TaxID=2969249 RepID=A0A9X2MMV5_9BACL|nr:AraC family transcriptional regulator [Paenibacillus soyae]MCR2804838.1 AraC family transcriptional regulator [Paenibacillus soyae]